VGKKAFKDFFVNHAQTLSFSCPFLKFFLSFFLSFLLTVSFSPNGSWATTTDDAANAVRPISTENNKKQQGKGSSWSKRSNRCCMICFLATSLERKFSLTMNTRKLDDVTSIPVFVLPTSLPVVPSLVSDSQIDQLIKDCELAYPPGVQTSKKEIEKRRAFSERCDRQLATLKRKERMWRKKKEQNSAVKEFDSS